MFWRPARTAGLYRAQYRAGAASQDRDLRSAHLIRKTLFLALGALALGACSEEPSAQDRYEAGLVELAEMRRTQLQYELRDIHAELARAIRAKGFECDRIVYDPDREPVLIVCQTTRGEVTYRLRANGDLVIER